VICPNCSGDHTPLQSADACLLGALANVVRDRGDLTEEQILSALPNIDADSFWGSWGGPAADWLEAELRAVAQS
jgi:hypothetical protein